MAPSPDDLAIVRRIKVFRGLDPRMIQQMIARATTLPLREREVVCRQDDPATAFFIVVENPDKLRQFAADDRGSARNSLHRPR